MAELSKLTLPNNQQYDLKDAASIHGPSSSVDKQVILFDGTTGKAAKSDSGIYATATAGQLNATSYKVNEQCILQWNATTQSLDFIFP